MDYTDLSDEIEIEIPKHAQANYQYVMIRYLLLLKTAKKAEIIESLQRYNQNNENNYYQSVFDTLVNSKFNITEKNKKYTLSKLENFNDEQRAYEKWVLENSQQEEYCYCSVNECCEICALTKEDIEQGKL